MHRLEWSEVVEGVCGRRVVGALPTSIVRSVSTDTRSIQRGDLFFALRGERFDGHEFVSGAFRKGAEACVVAEDRVDDLLRSLGGAPGVCMIAVDDTLDALEGLAVRNRRIGSFEVVAITGSVGKTTTKEFLRAVLARRFAVAAAPGSFNNRIGVALTLLSADDGVEQLIVEMGTSGPGELSHLSRLVRPERVIVTAIAPAHLSGLGDLQGVIEAKREIFEGLVPDGVAYIDSGMPGFDSFVERAPGEVRTFAAPDHARPADFRVECCEPLGGGQTGHRFELCGETYSLRIPGRHNVLNAAAAVSVALDLGMTPDEVRAGLADCSLPPRRLAVHFEGDVLFVDDSYNANPRSMESAFDCFAELSLQYPGGRRIAVLGEMCELGDASRQLHEGVGRRLAEDPVDVLVTVGGDSRHVASGFAKGLESRGDAGSAQLAHFDGVADAREYLENDLRSGDKVLFKASNAVGVGRLAEELLAARRKE